MGALTKPKVYRLLADSYFQKGDYPNAKKYSDEFFVKKNPEDVILPDYEIKAAVESKTGGTADQIYNTYMAGVALDTTVDAKLGYLKKGIAYFKENKIRDKEALMIQKLIEIKPKPTLNDYFDLALAQYFTPDYAKSRATALVLIEKYPDQVYGYEWAYNNSQAIDTIKKDSIAVPDALKLYEFSQKDTAKFRKQYINSIRYLAAYYINVAKDKDKSLEFFTKWLEADVANAATIQQYIDQIKKMPVRPPATAPKGNPEPVPTNSTKKETPAKAKTKTATVTKKTVTAKK
jgi:tetratricopeptide (TPR) repeat protein